MKMNRSLPSNVVIQGHRIEFFYRNQPLTCFNCGMSHLRRNCNTSPRERINRFSMEDFPDIPHRVPENVIEEPGTDVVDMAEEAGENNEVRDGDATGGITLGEVTEVVLPDNATTAVTRTGSLYSP